MADVQTSAVGEFDGTEVRAAVLHSAGLFLVTLTTLVMEVVTTRFLSVATWYHLSFFAVSLAMLGMAAGAVHVFLGGREFDPPRVRRTLAERAVAFAVLVPLSHLALLFVPFPDVRELRALSVVALAGVVSLIAAPFYASGVVVTLALTRTGGRIGRLYAVDLAGASVGCLAVVVLLEWCDITTVVMLTAVAAAGGALCFERAAGLARRGTMLLPYVLAGLAALAAAHPGWLRLHYSKQRQLPSPAQTAVARWNSHSYVIARTPVASTPFYWGPGAGAATGTVRLSWVDIDGEAGTAISEWDGDPMSLEWVDHDVTHTPYALRQGRVAIIGVGGGRDVLSAIRAGSSRITGIEVNRVLLDLLRGTDRSFAGIADRRDVALVHDEARSYLSRTDERFDVVQMSLIDTWAATGAGAFTLSENGLYTVEGWRVFLRVLAPDGVFSVSRWFAPERVSETTRLLALGVAALLDAGEAQPASRLVLLSRGHIATLLCAAAPFTPEDRRRLDALAAREGFTVLVSPWTPPATDLFARAVGARSQRELEAAVFDPDLDYTAPTDQRPFFFNLLKLRSFRKFTTIGDTGILYGNVGATTTLVTLCLVAMVFVAGLIALPLVIAGPRLPQSGPRTASLAYFGLIGTAYMLVQVAFLQRFSVFLGHPTYTFAIILFSMILFTGVGSQLSERCALGRGTRIWLMLPAAIATVLAAECALLSPATAVTTPQHLGVRTLVVLLFTGPLSMLLGMCFPVGMRLVHRWSRGASAWMWGVNGGCGVLASVSAVMLAMAFGLNSVLLLAAVLYALVAGPLYRLAQLSSGAARRVDGTP